VFAFVCLAARVEPATRRVARRRARFRRPPDRGETRLLLRCRCARRLSDPDVRRASRPLVGLQRCVLVERLLQPPEQAGGDGRGRGFLRPRVLLGLAPELHRGGRARRGGCGGHRLERPEHAARRGSGATPEVARDRVLGTVPDPARGSSLRAPHSAEKGVEGQPPGGGPAHPARPLRVRPAALRPRDRRGLPVSAG
jgi:hypothetical protein